MSETSKQVTSKPKGKAVATPVTKRSPAIPEQPAPLSTPERPVVAQDLNTARQATGSKHDGFITKLISDTASAISLACIKGHDNHVAMGVGAAMEAMMALEPKDPIEGMIAGQFVALHSASMECLRRAMLGQSPEVASKLRKDGANLARAATDMLAALDRKRGKGGQHIRVERVMVSEGGQAIVGNISGGPARVGGQG